MDHLIESFPAYDIFGRLPAVDGYVHIRAGESLGLKRRGHYQEFKAGSVASYALEHNECPMAAVERAIENGHQLYWLNPQATCLTEHRRAKETRTAISVGMRVYFQGRRFVIEAAPNDNLHLRPVAPSGGAL